MATICNVRIFDGTAFRKESAVTFENGTVTALDDRREGEDMGGVLLCPGFVDIHMHGQKGLDSMRPGDNGRMAETQVKYGVTSFCPASCKRHVLWPWQIQREDLREILRGHSLFRRGRRG